MNVNPILPETEEEKRLFAIGEQNSKHRKDLKTKSLIKHTPNDLESDLIHALWQKQLQYHGQLPTPRLRVSCELEYLCRSPHLNTFCLAFTARCLLSDLEGDLQRIVP